MKQGKDEVFAHILYVDVVRKNIGREISELHHQSHTTTHSSQFTYPSTDNENVRSKTHHTTEMRQKYVGKSREKHSTDTKILASSIRDQYEKNIKSLVQNNKKEMEIKDDEINVLK